MRNLAKVLAFGGAALLMIAPLAALACPPPEPSPAPQAGEDPVAYNQRVTAWNAEKQAGFEKSRFDLQTSLWQRAESVLIARIDQVTLISTDMWGPMRRATLTPLASIKGPKFSDRFTLRDTGMTDCGPYGGGDAPSGKPGDLVVVYSGKGQPGNKTLLGAIGRAWIRDERVLKAFNAQP